MEMGSRESSHTYYSILGVAADSSDEEIRRAYRKLAMRWHPDKWTRSPALVGEAKHKFQQIQEAYSVLSDKSKRAMYDAGLYDPDEEVDEGFSDFLQEMMSLMADVRREEKVYSMEELQNMFTEMAKGFECPDWSESSQWPLYDSTQWGCGSLVYEDCRRSKRARCETNAWPRRSSPFQMSGFAMYGMSHFCS